ncbi:hypothetical protein FOL47_007398 [Perkinsus chesapeaki]|uniref:Uncharacterized protein n=1 Tax=Perkinsus chesapeaki TaxID=330153 RepID=A0A7J6LKP4_PERCH|nr:hypothetical protein FOL47_007398 [Perkinsus chesapeaki]
MTLANLVLVLRFITNMSSAFEVDRLEADWSPPVAGLPFYLTVYGSDFERNDDRILLVDYGTDCGGGVMPTTVARSWQTPSTIEGWSALTCGNPGSQTDKLLCGPMSLNVSGSYQVCVCDFSAASSCAQWNLFNHTVGQSATVSQTANLTIGGPNIGHTYQSQAGQSVDISFTGTTLRQGDRLLVGIGQCGPSTGQSDLVTLGAARSSDSTSTLEVWEGVVATAAGKYVICWCADGDYRGTGCSANAHFNVEVGRLVVAGPHADRNTARLKIGVPGSLVVYGQGLRATDRVRLLPAAGGGCGSDDAPVTNVHLAAPDVESDDVVEFWSQVRSPAAGNFIMCWCGYISCMEFGKFHVSAGTLAVIGPLSNQFWYPSVTLRTNITIQASGNLFENVESEIRFAPLSSQGCGSTDVLMLPETIINSRGRHDRVGTDGSWASWDSVIFVRAGKYRVCWCGYGCTTPQDFLVDCGLVVVSGPEPPSAIQWEVSGRPFELRLHSTGSGVFSPMRDRLMVISNSTKCGRAETIGAALTPDLMSSTSTVEVYKNIVIGGLGGWNVCWCGYGGDCTDPSSFAPLVAVVEASEASGEDVFCTTGSSGCVVEVQSNGGKLSARSDRIWLVRLGTSSHCGFATHDYDRWREGPLTATLTADQNGLTDDELADLSILEFRLPVPMSAGEWRLCYCQSFGSCIVPINFANRIGSLVVGGVSGGADGMAVDHLCYLGTECAIKINGIGLSRGDTLRIANLSDFVGCQNVTRTIARQIFNVEVEFMELSTNGAIESFLPAAGGSVSLRYDVGKAKDISDGEVMVCHCKLLGSCQAAGRLALRGVVQRAAALECQHGAEACEVGLASAVEMTPGDKIVAIPAEEECGSEDVSQAVAPARAGQIERVASSGLWRATFSLERAIVESPGRFKICFCATVTEGSFTCGASLAGNEYIQEAGRLVVLGVIMGISKDETLLSTSRAVTILVDVGEAGGNLVCSASSFQQTEVPTAEAILDCENFVANCVGTGRRPDATLAERSAQVHISLNSDEAAANEEVRVWCVDTSAMCCVSPNNRFGLAVELRETLGGIGEDFVAREGEEFALPLDILYGESPSVKVVRGNSCSSNSEESVTGILCASGAFGRCEFTKPGKRISIGRIGDYTACFCDRFYNDGNECYMWEVLGSIRAIGASRDFFNRQEGRPRAAFTVVVRGLGLSNANRIQLVSGDDCGGIIIYDGLAEGPIRVNETYQEFGVPAVVEEEGVLQVCWCFDASSGACEKHIGVVDVVSRVDCILGDWIVIGSCSRTCGGGVLSRRRTVIQEASGGGTECPSSSELLGEWPCNEQRCPSARLDYASTSPSAPVAGVAFKIMVRGSELVPSRERIMVVSFPEEASASGAPPCGRTDGRAVTGVVAGGKMIGLCKNVSARCDQSGSTSSSVICGDGVQSIVVDLPGRYALCMCDAVTCPRLSDYARFPTVGGWIEVAEDPSVVKESGILARPEIWVVGGCGIVFTILSYFGVGDNTPTELAEGDGLAQWGWGHDFHSSGRGFDPGWMHYGLSSSPLALPEPPSSEERIPPPPTPRGLWAPQKSVGPRPPELNVVSNDQTVEEKEKSTSPKFGGSALENKADAKETGKGIGYTVEEEMNTVNCITSTPRWGKPRENSGDAVVSAPTVKQAKS